MPPGTLWVGSPARQLKELKPEQMERIAFAYRHYVNSGAMYLKRFGRKHIDSMMGGVFSVGGPLASHRYASRCLKSTN